MAAISNERPWSEILTVALMLCLFSIVGIVGNATAFYIFWKRKPPSTSVIFILALAGTDFFTCLVTIPYTVIFELLRYQLVYDVVCKMYFFLVTSTVPFSAYIMVGIALDRYFCICHPFMDAITINRARIVILFLGIPAFIFGIITALSFGTYTKKTTTYPNLRSLVNISENSTTAELIEGTKNYFTYQIEKYGSLELIDVHVVLANESKTRVNATDEAVITYYQVKKECVQYYDYFSTDFQQVYQKVHACGFLVSYVAVAILYILIYKSIYTRRANKARRKRTHLYPMSGTGKSKGGRGIEVGGQGHEETQMTVVNGGENNGSGRGSRSGRPDGGEDEAASSKLTLTARNDAGIARSPARSRVKDMGAVYIGIPEEDDEVTNALPSVPKEDSKPAAVDSAKKDNESSKNATIPQIKEVGTALNSDKGTGDSNPANMEQVKNQNEAVNEHPGLNTASTKDSESNLRLYTAISPNPSCVTLGDLKELETEATELNAEHDHALTKKEAQIQEQKPLLAQTKSTMENGRTPSRNPPTSLPIQSQHCGHAHVTPSPSKHHNHADHSNTTADNMSSSKKNKNGSSKLTKPKKHASDAQANSIKRKRTSASRDGNLMANIKTAFMLFIVTLVFSIAFLPSLLMANELIPFNLVVFYSYFIYNVANPFIYAFMNQTFREDLKRIIKGCSY